MTRRKEASVQVAAAPEAVFARLDDQTRLAEHMARPSLMMGGGRMTYEFDADRGQAVGSRIRMGGRAFGLTLEVEEVVTERAPPNRKAWRTAGEPRLLVIDGYAMGFEILPRDGGSELRVWIDYAPAGGWLGRLPALGDAYARWCVDRMVADARRAFGPPAGGPAA